MYIIKEYGAEPRYFSTMTQVAEFVGCSVSSLKYHFSVKKKKKEVINMILIERQWKKYLYTQT